MCDNPGSAIASQVVARVEGSHRIRLQTQVDGKRMERLSIKSINAWLLAQGLIAETKEPTTIQRTIRRPVGKSSEIGIQELEITDAYRSWARIDKRQAPWHNGNRNRATMHAGRDFMPRRKQNVSVYHNPVSDADVQKYREDDRPLKIVIGGLRVNHRPASAREFKRAIRLPLILTGICLLGLALYSVVAALLAN